MTASSTAHKGPLSAVPFVVLVRERVLFPLVRASLLKKKGARAGGGGCAGCLWARERYAMSALRLFHNRSKAKGKA